MYSIGKLASISQISVRTIRYYDEIGLLLPTKKSEAGHRYYADEALSKLHYILTLRKLGFPLEMIQQVLSSHNPDLMNVLAMRLKMIQVERKKLDEMETSINTLLDLIELEQHTDWKSIFATFYSFPNGKDELKQIWATYFSVEEQRIVNNFPLLGDGSKQTEQWMQLLKDVRLNLSECPKSELAQGLAKRWITLVEEMYEGNFDLAQKIWNMNKSNGDNFGFYQFDQKIVSFIDQAINHHYEGEK